MTCLQAEQEETKNQPEAETETGDEEIDLDARVQNLVGMDGTEDIDFSGDESDYAGDSEDGNVDVLADNEDNGS